MTDIWRCSHGWLHGKQCEVCKRQAELKATIEAKSKLLRNALKALGACRIMGPDDDGNYTVEITQRQFVNAIAVIKQFKEQK